MKRFAVILITIAIILCAVPHASAAENTEIALDAFQEKAWSGEGLNATRRTSQGKPLMSLSLEKAKSEATFTLTVDPVNLSLQNQLEVKLSLRGSAKEYSVYVCAFGNGKRGETVSLSSDFSETETIFVPLSHTIKGALNKVQITINAKEGELSYALLSGITATDRFSYKYRESFMANDITADVGRLIKTEDGFSLFTLDGKGTIAPDYIAEAKEDMAYTVWLSARDVSTGSIGIRAFVEKTTEADEDRPTARPQTTLESVPVSGTQAMIAGDHTYSFTVYGAFDKIEFFFTDISTSGSSGVFFIHASGILPSGIYNKDSVGTVVSCQGDKNTIKLSGTISSQQAAKYVNCKLGLFAIELWKSYDANNLKNPIATTAFSTKFSLTAPAPKGYSQYKYVAAIITDKSTVPISSPLLAASPGYMAPVGGSQVTALDASDAANVFETGVSSTIIDVYVNRLFATDSSLYSAILRTYGSEYYYFDSEYIEEIENRLAFAAAAGINVYLRLCTDEKQSFSFDANDKKTTLSMCAAADLISERFATVKAYIFGNCINNDFADYTTSDYLSATAKAIGVFASCLNSTAEGYELYVPFDYSSGANAGCVFFALRHALSMYTTQKFSVLFTDSSSSPQTAALAASRCASAAGAYGYNTGRASILWSVPAETSHETVIEKYTLLCSMAINQGMGFSAMNTNNLPDTKALLDALKRTVNDKSIFTSKTTWYKAIVENTAFTSSAPLWDFRNAYDTKGFVSGGGFADVLTEDSQFFASRVLKCNVSDRAKGAGIVICRPESPLNMSDCFLRINLGVISKTKAYSDSADVTVIIGSKTNRAEFTASVSYNKATELLCYMAPFDGAQSVDYAAVILRSADGATLEVSQIDLCSTILSQETLDTRTDLDQERSKTVLYVVAAATVALTATLFAILVRKKQDKH